MDRVAIEITDAAMDDLRALPMPRQLNAIA